MDVSKTKSELRRMCKADLLKLLTRQRISKCIIKEGVCCFHFHYKECNFCVSEILGESCQFERLDKVYPDIEKINHSMPLAEELRTLAPGKRAIEFGVYWRDHITHSIGFLGKIIERRKKERGNILRDLLNKAIRDFSNRVKDPSTIFLLGT
jgi:hypothetical protein